MLRIVHCADAHLETTFPDARGGARRRAALAEAFARIVDLALERRADVLMLGGDIYEAQRAGPQTARFLFEQLARFGGPTFVSPGNHDPYSAASIYARSDLPPNVRVFAEARWQPVPLSSEVTLYGFGHTPAEPGRPFADARFDRGEIRIALVHGSDEDRCPHNKNTTAPFNTREIAASGATFVATGHYHGGYTQRTDRPIFAYPGSPEPIKFGESNVHGALVLDCENGRVEVEAVQIARTRLVERTIDLDGITSEHAAFVRLDDALAPLGANDYVRVRLTGAIERGTRIDAASIVDRYTASLGGLEVFDESVGFDYEAIALEPTVRGHAVRDLLDMMRSDDAAVASRAHTALRATLAAFENLPIAPEFASG